MRDLIALIAQVFPGTMLWNRTTRQWEALP